MAHPFFALCLSLSSFIPIVIFFQLVPPQVREGNVSILFVLVPMCLLFVFCIYAGIRFFMGRVAAYRWSLILFVSQIPIVEVGHFGYRWYTGLEIALVFQGVDGKLAHLAYNVAMGANASFNLGDPMEASAVGINLFALVAAIVLFRARKRILPAEGRELEASA